MSAEPQVEVVIHVGYHKTGSKWLQQRIFASSDQGFAAPWTVRSGEAIREFVVPSRFHFDPRNARKVFAAGIHEAAGRGLVPVVSHEDLCGFPVLGRYYGPEVAERLHATFPQARVFLCVREQKAMLFSMYQQYLRQYGVQPIEEFIGRAGDVGGHVQPLCRLDHLEYHFLVGLYQRLFGASNVLVLPLELLRADSAEYLRRLGQFAGVGTPATEETSAVNTGWSGLTLAMRRRINGVLPAPTLGRKPGFGHRSANRLCHAVERVLPPGVHRGVEARWKRFVAERVAGVYGSSNRQLAEMTGLELESYGYDLAID